MPVYQVSLAPTTAIPAASAFSIAMRCGAVRDDVTDVVAAIERGRRRASHEES